MKIVKFSLIVAVFLLLMACNGGSSDTGSSDTGSNEEKPQDKIISGLIAQYSFDEEYGNLALDSTNNDNSGIITAASRVDGRIGKGLLFGFDESRVRVDAHLYFVEDLITIEAWIKPDMIGDGEVYCIIGDYISDDFYFQIRDGRLEILFEEQSYHYGSVSIQPDVWTHVAFTSDGTNIVTYINGVEDARTNINLPIQDLMNIRIGVHEIYHGYTEEFPGVIDELRIWDIARTQDQIAADSTEQLIAPATISNNNNYPSALFSFDEVYGNLALNSASDDYNCVITAASRVEGKIGKGLLFGIDDTYVTSDDSIFFDEGLVTIEAWIKPDMIVEEEVYRIIGDYNYHGFYFQIRDGRLEILFEGQSYHYGTTSIQPSVWTHIAFTSDGTDIVTYINGVEDARTNITLPIQALPVIRIGVHEIYTGVPINSYIEGFHGIIDEFQIWDIARTQDEIVADSAEQLIAPPTVSINDKELLVLFSFDELSGDIAYDTSGSDYEAIITAASRVEGKIGNGLYFGLDDSYVTLNDSIFFDEGLITIEAWIKPDAMDEGEIYRIIGAYQYNGLYFQIRDGRLEILFKEQSYHYGITSIQPGVWTHIAFTSDGMDIVTYINGVEDARTNITLPIEEMQITRIGANRIYTGGTPLHSYIEEFPGIIDELQIWDGVRTSSELLDYINAF